MKNIEYIALEIKGSDKNSMLKIRDKIHNLLVGNEDYIENNIILTDSDNINSLNNKDHVDNNIVFIYIFKDCKNIHDIILKINESIT